MTYEIGLKEIEAAGYIPPGAISEADSRLTVPNGYELLGTGQNRRSGDFLWDPQGMKWIPFDNSWRLWVDRYSRLTIRKQAKTEVCEMMADLTLKSVGMKHDSEKPRWDLLPWAPVLEIVKVLTHGAKKYAPRNWEHVPGARDRYFRATIGHVTSWYQGERNDPEWGLNHLAHAGCCILFLLWFDLTGKWPADKVEK